MKVFVKGLNPCAARRVNVKQYCDYLIQNGHEVTSSPEESQYVLLWGCGFRTDYRNNSIAEANRYKNELKKEVILTGCIPDIDPLFIADNFKGEIINWRDDEAKLEKIFGSPNIKLNEIKLDLGKKKLCNNANEYKKANPDKDACYLDEQIQIYASEGCMLECSYCSEKLMFPPYQSYPQDQILSTVKQHVQVENELNRSQYIAVMLQADSIGDYGKDIGTNLPDLIEKIVALDPKIKIGLQGFNPAHFLEYYNEMIDFVKRGKISHLRLPIQSASSRILTLMKRKYSPSDIEHLFGSLNKINFKDFSTDAIVGFPGETVQEYEETANFILKHHPKYVLLSVYMDFPNLPAYNLPDKVGEEEKQRRLKSADERFTKMGIYCSTDGGQLTTERRRRLNMDYRI